MYRQYFGLSEAPFSIAPDPHFLYLSEFHREAIAHLLYGIENGGCLVLLTGEVGTGKTTVSRCLVEQLPTTCDVALILNPKLTALELLSGICDELHIDTSTAPPTAKHLIDALNRHLLEAHARGRNTVLIVDEAQDLDLDILEQLRLLTNLETDKEKLLKIILLGQPELRETLGRPELAQFNQRITSRYHLPPLTRQDVFAYIDHRCRIAGTGRARLFTDRAVRRIFQYSAGIPRLINLLCDRSLLGAYVEEKDLVDCSIVDKAAREVLDLRRRPTARRIVVFSLFRRPPILTVSLVLALAVTAGALVLFSPKTGDLIHEQKTATHNHELVATPDPALGLNGKKGQKPSRTQETSAASIRQIHEEGHNQINGHHDDAAK